MPVLLGRLHLLQSVERQAGLALQLRLPPRQDMAPVGHSFGSRKSAKVKRVFFAYFVLAVAQYSQQPAAGGRVAVSRPQLPPHHSIPNGR